MTIPIVDTAPNWFLLAFKNDVEAAELVALPKN